MAAGAGISRTAETVCCLLLSVAAIESALMKEGW